LYGNKSKISYVIGNIHLIFANSFSYFKWSKIVFSYVIGKNIKSQIELKGEKVAYRNHLLWLWESLQNFKEELSSCGDK